MLRLFTRSCLKSEQQRGIPEHHVRKPQWAGIGRTRNALANNHLGICHKSRFESQGWNRDGSEPHGLNRASRRFRNRWQSGKLSSWREMGKVSRSTESRRSSATATRRSNSSMHHSLLGEGTPPVAGSSKWGRLRFRVAFGVTPAAGSYDWPHGGEPYSQAMDVHRVFRSFRSSS